MQTINNYCYFITLHLFHLNIYIHSLYSMAEIMQYPINGLFNLLILYFVEINQSCMEDWTILAQNFDYLFTVACVCVVMWIMW